MIRILIVDDVQDYLDALDRALAGTYEVVKASSLREAKQKMDISFGLALVDVRLSEEDMSNRDGIILLGWLRENFPQIPVLMMSAYKDFDSAVDAVNLGAEMYLKKPINLRELKNHIGSLARGSA